MAPGLKQAPDCEHIDGHDFRVQTWTEGKDDYGQIQRFAAYFYCARCLLFTDQQGNAGMNLYPPISKDVVAS